MAKSQSSFSRNLLPYGQRTDSRIKFIYFSSADFFLDSHGGDIHEGLVPFVIYSPTRRSGTCGAHRGLASCPLLAFPYVVGSYFWKIALYVLAAKSLEPQAFWAEVGQLDAGNAGEVDSIQNRCFWMSFVPLSGSSVRFNFMTWSFWEKIWSTTASVDGCCIRQWRLDGLSKKGQKLGENPRLFWRKWKRRYLADSDAFIWYLSAIALRLHAKTPFAASGVLAAV